jgi:small subunit ribosomal protein S1
VAVHDQDNLDLFLSHVNAIPEPVKGKLIEGRVIAIDDHGMIVDLGMKRDGVVPKVELERIDLEEAGYAVGASISVMVIEPVDKDGNLVVSISQARESGDWLKARKIMEADTILEAPPQGYNRGGLIVPFGRLRGFVPASHLSELPRGLSEEEREDHLRQMLDKVMPFKIIEVDPQRQRLVMSERKAVRQWRLEQKAKLISSLKEGESRQGVVTSLREFGAFVDIGGADGLIHISELSWKRVNDPGEILKIGENIEVLVLRLDQEAKRIGLSLKRLQPNPWEQSAETIKPGVMLEGAVSRQAMSGVYVNVGQGLEGLMRAASLHQLPSPGTTVKVRVINFDVERERMDLELVDSAETVQG